MHAARDLAGGIQALNRLTVSREDVGVNIDLQAAHAVVDHWRDDRHIKRLRLHLRPGDDVVVELFTRPRLAAGLVPRLARGVRRPRAAVGVALRLLRRLVMLLVRLLEHGKGHAHVIRERQTVLVVLHHTAAGVVLAMPDDLLRRRFVQRQSERRLVLPHLASDVVAAPELVGEALAVGVQNQAADTAESLGSQELDLRVRIVRLHQAGRVDLHPLEVDSAAADGFAHLDAVAGAVLAVGRRQVH
mmetsp:Transcript_126763/g.364584  ORF Transcript_126763/g.364584 Transcript_126763/m.364584 type:complete len:245 (-) Transcript_126763:719-1453(-)